MMFEASTCCDIVIIYYFICVFSKKIHSLSMFLVDPLNLEMHSISSPPCSIGDLRWLVAVTSASMVPWRTKSQHSFDSSCGTCPTVVPSFLRAIANGSSALPGSLSAISMLLSTGVHVDLYTWKPLTALSSTTLPAKPCLPVTTQTGHAYVPRSEFNIQATNY